MFWVRSNKETKGCSKVEKAFEVESLCRSFKGVEAVKNLTLSLNKGEVLGFIGTNGAGKTTTIKMLLGLLPVSSGKLSVLGGDPSDPEIRRRLGYMPETANYYPYLNAWELLSFYGGLCGLDKKTIRERSEKLLDEVDLLQAAKRRLKTYSKGMLQRAGLAQALLADPDLLILDEPFTGLDPLARIRLRNLIKRLRDEGKSIFFSSHELGETELLCDRVAIIKDGHCFYQGPVTDIAGDGKCNLERLFLETLDKAKVEG